MPTMTPDDQPRLFLSGSTPLSRHTSSMGAIGAADRIARQCLQLLTLYRERGPLTDAEAAAAMDVERTTINARRADLIERGLVAAQPVGHRKNPATGINNAVWDLARDPSPWLDPSI